ncbi:MAG TPA: hypothetical protein VN179_05390 [Solirubrobacterales bacterium]|jgi:hypothetical protein|nr:hypothetical protein [Solirubrobacterales bacterium]
MKADYDSQANAVSIDLLDVDRWDDGGEFDENYCTIAFSEGRVANIGLLCPSDNLHLLEAVAARFDLDTDKLIATAKAALAAPDRAVTISDRLAA